MEKKFKKSFERFENIEGDKYADLPIATGIAGNSYMMQFIRKEDHEVVWIQVMPDNGGYFVFTPENEHPSTS